MLEDGESNGGEEREDNSEYVKGAEKVFFLVFITITHCSFPEN
jgi:hypothetical protein